MRFLKMSVEEIKKELTSWLVSGEDTMPTLTESGYGQP